jgi:hypothetical protein
MEVFFEKEKFVKKKKRFNRNIIGEENNNIH